MICDMFNLRSTVDVPNQAEEFGYMRCEKRGEKCVVSGQSGSRQSGHSGYQDTKDLVTFVLNYLLT